MKRLIISTIPALLGALAFGATAFAAAGTETITEHNATDSFTQPVCEDGPGPLYDIEITYNSVEHVTETPTGFHETFTQAGTFVATNTETGEVVTGHFTVWGGFNANPGGEVNGTFTFSARGIGDEGTRINAHQMNHFDSTPGGMEHEFFRNIGCE